MKNFLTAISIVFIAFNSQAQNNNTVHKAEIWLGYISAVNFNEKFSAWNDFHFVLKSFFISRHGITYHLAQKATLTAGYAWALTSTTFTDQLIRFEHRPWGQLEFIQPIHKELSFRFRIRYDARFQKKVNKNQMFDDFISYNRIRFLNGIRFPVVRLKNEKNIYLNLMNETLLNFGKEVTENNLDQNRIWVLVGVNWGNISLMPGYEFRFVPTVMGNQNIYHGLVLWIVQDFKLKRTLP